jgi:hypothetical protein
MNRYKWTLFILDPGQELDKVPDWYATVSDSDDREWIQSHIDTL